MGMIAKFKTKFTFLRPFLRGFMVLSLMATAALRCSSAQNTSKRSEKQQISEVDELNDLKKANKTKRNNEIPKDGDDNVENDPDNTPPKKDPKTEKTAVPLTSESYFTSVLEPLFRSSCKQCHADPKQVAGVAAPLTIYSYQNMLAMIGKAAVGEATAQSNLLIDKVQGKPTHPGGDRCKGLLTASPCKEVAMWWDIINGKTVSNPKPEDFQGKIGRVFEVSANGRVYGWAVNPKVPGEQVKVKVYVGGPKGQGSDAGTFDAFVNGNDDNTPGNHAFIAELPAAYRNGKQNTVFVYALIDGEELALNSEPISYIAWAPTAAGQTFYNGTVAAALNGCRGCHAGKNYEAYYANLFNPPPHKGGTATNNDLINKTGGLNGVGHSGGNSCGGNANSGICATLQTWWRMEFGQTP